MHRDGEGDYEVGYGKPPKKSQFRKGQSGNPKGRPKGSKNLAGLFRSICNERVRITGRYGTAKYMTKLEASITQLVNKAASGDLKAIREIVYLSKQFPQALDPVLPPPKFVINFVKSPYQDEK
jgi:hypothetical protein